MDGLCLSSLVKVRACVDVAIHGLLAMALIAVLVPAGLTGCGGGSDGSRSGGGGGKQRGTLTILAASSLTDAFGELGNTFEKQNPGTTVKASFGASSDLLAQIQQGAPADVFASAAEEEMDTAVEGRPRRGETRSLRQEP